MGITPGARRRKSGALTRKIPSVKCLIDKSGFLRNLHGTGDERGMNMDFALLAAMTAENDHINGRPNGSASISLDEIDAGILRVLEASGRASNQEIGDRVGLSPSAVSRRIQTLESAGVILGYKAIVDDSRLGRGMTVFMRVTLERQSATALSTFETAVQKAGSISFCHLVAGQYDYLLQVKTADISQWERLYRETLSTLPGIARLESNFSVRTVVDSGKPTKLLKLP
jgi:DNA-binding Lrp family transcriptional regulator